MNPFKQQCCLKHWIFDRLDFRYWFCECYYMCPYGLVIFADCEKHDSPYIKVKKKDLRGNFKIKIDPKSFATKNDDPYITDEGKSVYCG